MKTFYKLQMGAYQLEVDTLTPAVVNKLALKVTGIAGDVGNADLIGAEFNTHSSIPFFDGKGRVVTMFVEKCKE